MAWLLQFAAAPRPCWPAFAATSYLKAIAWLKDDADDLYDPSYGDVIRVAGLLGFSRGKASSIVSELSGRDPETRKVDEARIPVAYDTCLSESFLASDPCSPLVTHSSHADRTSSWSDWI